MSKLTVIAVSLAFIAGCTSKVTSIVIDPANTDESPRRGEIYYIPKPIVLLTRNVELQSCTSLGFKLKQNHTLSSYTNEVGILLSLDQSTLLKPTKKVSSTKTEYYSSARLKSFGASIESKEKEIVSNIISTSINIASIALAAFTSDKPCTPYALSLLSEKTSTSAMIATLKAELESNKNNAAKLKELTEVILKLEKNLQTIQSSLTVKLSDHFISLEPSDKNSAALPYEARLTKADEENIKTLFDLNFLASRGEADPITLNLRVTGDLPNLKNPRLASGTSIPGIAYIQPLPIMLEVQDIEADTRSKHSLEVPGYGVLAYIPYENGPFQSNSVALGFNERGGIGSLEYKSDSAAQAASETALDSSQKIKDANASFKDTE